MGEPAPKTSPCLEVRNVTKTFGAVHALRKVNLTVVAGQVHGILGANGAGKSTLIKILAGIYPHGSYDGEIYLRDELVEFRSPHNALESGLGYVPQELNVVEPLTVAENIYVGRLNPDRRPTVRMRQVRRRAKELLAQWRIPLRAEQVVSTLRASERQLVMIARSLAGEPSVLILDEPTSSLTSDESARLFGIVGSLKAGGVTVLLITHRMSEIFDACDAATILRDGTAVASYERAEFDEDQMVQDMVGRRLATLFPERKATMDGQEALRVEHMTVRHPYAPDKRLVADVSFSVRRGEILGIAGMMGAGRTELLNAIYGRLPHDGTIYLDSAPTAIHSPRDAKRAGIALLTEDRKGEGILFNLDVGRNISVGNLAGVSTHGLLRSALERSRVRSYMHNLAIKPADSTATVDKLSGGNQQKLLFARVLMEAPSVILLDEPTKGVDIETKREIYGLMRSLAGQGRALVVVSSEFPELIGVCDRILVLAEGRIVDEVQGDGTTEERLVAAATGEQ